MGINRVFRAADTISIILWLGALLCNMAAGAFSVGQAGPKPIAYGSITVGSLWGLTLFGIFLLAFFSAFSSRRLNSRRRRFFKVFFSIILPTRFVCSLVWVCLLPFLKHTRPQQAFSLACLLDVLLLGRHLLVISISPDAPDYIDLEEDSNVATKSGQVVPHAAGCISSAKAAIVIETRRRQYGPKLSSVMPLVIGVRQSVPDQPAESQAVLYAQREKFPSDRKHSHAASTLAIDERQQLELFPDFLRCTCCIDCSSTSNRDWRKHDVEAGPLNARNQRLDQKRLSFLKRDPVAAVFDFVPKDRVTNGVHDLCGICDNVCAEIINHLATVERRSKLERSLHPQRDVCSLSHHDDPNSLRKSSLTCHLCALIWGSLNDGQQESLLRGDEQLVASSSDPISSFPQSIFQMQRRIRLVVFEDVLVPHFGGFKRPRRWERSSPDFEAMKTDVGSEFANPLYLPGPQVDHRYLYKSYGERTSSPKETSGPIIFPVSNSTGSQCVIDLISRVLKDRRSLVAGLPTRILDVRGFQTGRVRLRHSEDVDDDERKQYIALSHCWGKINMPRLLKHNIEHYLEGFEISQLPRTFQEAIEVTFRLEVAYLWIDSLCIIQDDPRDWENEAAHMAYIYRDAFCTIAAVASSDGNGGLFRPQYPKKLSPCLVGLKEWRSDPVYAVPYPQSDDRGIRANIALSKWNSRGWCLQERKCSYVKERVQANGHAGYLSRAVIYFCESQIYIGVGDQLAVSPKDHDSRSWIEQEETRASVPTNEDDDPMLDSLPTSNYPGATSTSARRALRPSSRRKEEYALKGQLDTEAIWDHRFTPKYRAESLNSIRMSMVSQRLGTNTVVDPNSIWWAAINEYTMRDLTNALDKLPAIRGLAVFLHDSHLSRSKSTESRYIMGHWTTSMAAGLLWYVDLGAERERPALYRAPSWSWASVEGVVSNDSLLLDEENAGIEVLGFDIRDSNAMPAQRWLQDQGSQGSSVTLRGSLAAACWSAASSQSEKRYYVARSLVRHHSRDLEAVSALTDLFSPVSTEPQVGPLCHALLHPVSGERIGWFLPDSPEELASEIFCLKIQVTPTDSENPQATWAVRGLVLIPCAPGLAKASSSLDPADGSQALVCYRRVGYFQLDCEFRGTRVGSEYSHTEEVTMPRRPVAMKVARYIEFPIMNEPILDPRGFFADVKLQNLVLV